MKKVDQTHTPELWYKQRSAAKGLIKLPWLQNPLTFHNGQKEILIIFVTFNFWWEGRERIKAVENGITTFGGNFHCSCFLLIPICNIYPQVSSEISNVMLFFLLLLLLVFFFG